MWGTYVWLITGDITPEPACFTEKSVTWAVGWSLCPIEPITSDCLPSHPKQKMVEPQTAVSPLLGLISVAYWWRVGMTGCLCIHHQCKHLWFQTKADREAAVYGLALGWRSNAPSLLNTVFQWSRLVRSNISIQGMVGRLTAWISTQVHLLIEWHIAVKPDRWVRRPNSVLSLPPI